MSRRPHDAYMTPAWQVEALLQHQPLGEGITLFECCSGDRSIIAALPTLPPLAPAFIHSCDIDPTHQAMYCSDAAEAVVWAHVLAVGGCDWVVTNPPFAKAYHLPILMHAYRTARIGVAMICRLSFLEPTKDRGPWLAAHPPDRMIVLPRHSYTGNGSSDVITTAWLIWLKDPAWQAWATTVPPIVIAHGAKGK